VDAAAAPPEHDVRRLTRLWRGGWRALRRQISLHGWRGVVRRVPHYMGRAGQWGAVARAEASAALTAPSGLRPLRLHPELQAPQPELQARVSVVIPTLNAGPEFDLLLAKLNQQRGVQGIELVIVDSGSTDGTVAVAQRHGARVVPLAKSAFSHSHARNLGADAAQGSHLLFMVQDAYPIGERWIEGLLRGLLDRQAMDVVAVSSAEVPRLDSEFFYDWNAATHYAFLGCDLNDRVGHLAGDDHGSLRRMGQLSDVACLIPRPVFQRYRYRGDYAEDMDLGVRLIRDGHRVAMLAAVKVLHSHHRPPLYYLKRGFVDLVFLREVFADFPEPACPSIAAALEAAQRLLSQVQGWRARVLAGEGADALDRFMGDWLDSRPFDADDAPGPPCDAALADFVAEFQCRGRTPTAAEQAAARRALADDLTARCRHLLHGLQPAQPGADARVRVEVADAVAKALAATLGAAMAGAWWGTRDQDAADPERVAADQVFARLKAGV